MVRDSGYLPGVMVSDRGGQSLALCKAVGRLRDRRSRGIGRGSTNNGDCHEHDVRSSHARPSTARRSGPIMRLTERLRGQRRLQISDMVPSPRLLEPPARHHVYLSFRNGNVGGTPDATVAHDLALMLEAKGVSVWRDAYWDTTQPNAMNGKQQSEGALASALGAAAPAAAPSVFVGASVRATSNGPVRRECPL